MFGTLLDHVKNMIFFERSKLYKNADINSILQRIISIFGQANILEQKFIIDEMLFVNYESLIRGFILCNFIKIV